MLLNFSHEDLVANKGLATLTEITQQPQVWAEVLTLIENQKQVIENFLATHLTPDTQIIFTGAGTSEFAGNVLYLDLIKKGYDAKSIATTDLVTHPTHFLNSHKPTLLVSFARSGNSPESVATYNIVQQYVTTVSNLVITCNKDGALAKIAQINKNDLVLLMPEVSNDKSFAMTSSFTGMMVAAWLIFDLVNFVTNKNHLIQAIKEIDCNLKNNFLKLENLANQKHERIVFLGGGILKGIAEESALKVLELSAGEVATFFNTPVGFRHGPKSILNDKTIAFVLMNRNEYARRYDLDLLKELATQNQLNQVIAIDCFDASQVSSLVQTLSCPLSINDDFLMGLNYVTQSQVYAFYKSLSLAKTPDNPWPSGLVNRVVQGVIIHEFKA
ncbi:tagatose-6-phosphate ketose/aldose isomerase [Entomoplasma freundtii]|uniref:Tagatose-6-phosphate ketose/aldose isomerase n=1 Tax=Entomoplasma freundtii TaxID=74700 RepID=A0A2K8NQW0_9MOLU|nr:SIS domain-containing protein [Entomoplasma freundtii]ATZ16222.1 tagatose-6-phosphate ketose/aldose isomerase [Entomoplasma freundtii]TDY56877.1 tagatose-6-phosphate ketose/aldose isomerase [Entomoplasma freundtii]